MALVFVLIAVLAGQLLGFISVESALSNFYLFIIVLLSVTVLAIIGAVFLGIFISHRIYTAKDFTPFENEMLGMKEEIGRIVERLDKLAEEISKGKAK